VAVSLELWSREPGDLCLRPILGHNADDKAKPRVQRYRIFADMPIARPKEQLVERSNDRAALASLPLAGQDGNGPPLAAKGTILDDSLPQCSALCRWNRGTRCAGNPPAKGTALG